MSDIVKVLASGIMQGTVGSPATVYTTNGNRTTLIKSLLICNPNNAPTEVVVTISNVYYMRYTMKASETIHVPIADQFLITTADAVRMGASARADYYLCGIEIDTRDNLGPYYNVKRLARTNISSTSGTIVNSSSIKRMIKNFVVCNTSSTAVTLRVNIGIVNILWDYPLKGYETLVIPSMDLILEAGDSITAVNSSNSASVAFHITGLELV